MFATSSSSTRPRPAGAPEGAPGPLEAAPDPGGADTRPLAGRHAVVTGAGRGIGAAIAAELARLGADLTLLGRGADALRERQRELASGGARVGIAIADVTRPEEIADAFAAARARYGAPLILVNDAGDALSAPFSRTTPELWQRMLAVNVTGAYLCTREVVDGAVAAGWGRIVNVASTAGLKGYPYATAYAASKHALVGLTRSLALELARTGVTVNAVCPGYTDTDLVTRAASRISAATGRSETDARAALVAVNPMGRLVTPAEVAAAVGWLCLPAAASVTGETLVVAGGELS